MSKTEVRLLVGLQGLGILGMLLSLVTEWSKGSECK